MANCRSCGADIEWAEWEKSGKATPLDLAPDPKGKLVLVNGKIRYATLEDDRLKRERRVSHFSSCPDAQQWRGGRE